MIKSSWYELIGLLGVVSSLVFVGIEIRQNTSAIKGATHQTIAEENNQAKAIKVFITKQDITQGLLMERFEKVKQKHQKLTQL